VESEVMRVVIVCVWFAFNRFRFELWFGALANAQCTMHNAHKQIEFLEFFFKDNFFFKDMSCIRTDKLSLHSLLTTHE
jgi:hypothetical protein